MFLNNAWYVAAWGNELAGQPLARDICGQPVVLYRDSDGVPVALANACPHRFAPLSMGTPIGDDLRCGYHGLRFGRDGRCTHNPLHGHAIPETLRVRAFPVVERHGMIWVWMGDADRVDEAAIPDFSFHTDPAFRRIGGMFEVKANYELITDNILDLTHGEFVHPNLLSTPTVTESRLETAREGTTIWANRWMPDGIIPPAWSAAFDNWDKPVAQWGYVRWDAPAHMVLDIGIAPVGGARTDGIWLYGTDIFTPKDDTSTYYFWAFSRNYEIDNPDVDAMWHAAIDLAFIGQDKPMLEAQQQTIGTRDIMDLRPVMVSSDAASTRVRRMLRKLIRDEAAGGGGLKVSGQPPLDLLAQRQHSNAPIEPVV